MIFFYLWVAFLASIVLAVPIVSFVEKSRARKASGYSTPAAAAEVAFEDEPVEPVAAAVADDGMGDFGAAPAGADDFSAFDDFK
jgi:hypothetical protein